MASCILGMGDLLSLMERAQRQFDEKETAAAQEKLLEGSFNLEDFLAQMQQVKKLGPMREVRKLIPGLGGQLRELEDAVDDKQLKRVEAIISRANSASPAAAASRAPRCRRSSSSSARCRR